MRRFARDGLRREPTARVLAKWGELLVTAYRVAGTDAQRRGWCRDLGRRVGRVVGSVCERTLYL
jgi:hypothetical protein